MQKWTYFSSQLDVGEAVKVAFNVLSSDNVILKKAAEILRYEIQVAFETSDDVPWPPPAKLFVEKKDPPQCGSNFVSQVKVER